jgi:hypothetical protein
MPWDFGPPASHEDSISPAAEMPSMMYQAGLVNREREGMLGAGDDPNSLILHRLCEARYAINEASRLSYGVLSQSQTSPLQDMFSDELSD